MRNECFADMFITKVSYKVLLLVQSSLLNILLKLNIV